MRAPVPLQAHFELIPATGLFSQQGHSGGTCRGAGESWRVGLWGEFHSSSALLACTRLLFTPKHKTLEQIRGRRWKLPAHASLEPVLPGTERLCHLHLTFTELALCAYASGCGLLLYFKYWFPQDLKSALFSSAYPYVEETKTWEKTGNCFGAPGTMQFCLQIRQFAVV